MLKVAKQIFVKVKRSIDERYFPTRSKLGQMLDDYAWKIVGHSVKQGGDPLQRYVVHIRPMKPYVYLLMEQPGTGKSTIARKLFQTGPTHLISGDNLYGRVARGAIKAPSHLESIITEQYKEYSVGNQTKKTFDWGDVTRRIIQADFLPELIDFWCEHLGEGDAAIDSYMPEDQHEAVKALFEKKGYVPVFLKWDMDVSMAPKHTAKEQMEAYETHLSSIDEITNQPIVVHRAATPAVRWHLDRPTSGDRLLAGEPLSVSGWVFPEKIPARPMVIKASCGGDKVEMPFKRKRSDVLVALLGSEEKVTKEYESKAWGFQIEVDPTWLNSGVKLSVRVDDVEFDLATLNFEGKAASGGGASLIGKIRKSFRRY